MTHTSTEESVALVILVNFVISDDCNYTFLAVVAVYLAGGVNYVVEQRVVLLVVDVVVALGTRLPPGFILNNKFHKLSKFLEFLIN